MAGTSSEPCKKRRRKRNRKKNNDKEEVASVDENEKNDEEIVESDDSDNKRDSHGEGNTPYDDKEQRDENDKAEDSTATKKRKRKRKRKNAVKIDSCNDNENETSNSDGMDDAAKLLSIEHTVYVEGLPFSSTEDDVRSFFALHGCHDVLQLRLPQWQDSGRLRGYGHVVFRSIEARTLALSEKVNGQELGGRYVTVTKPNPPRPGTTAGAGLGIEGSGTVRDQPAGCKKVFVRNLPYDATEEQIMESFMVCGKILHGGVRVVRNHVSGQSKGFGYVEYKNEEGALAAVQKAAKPFGLQVLGRPVFVDYDEGNMKGSFRDRDGRLWNKEHSSDKGGRGRGGTRIRSSGKGRANSHF